MRTPERGHFSSNVMEHSFYWQQGINPSYWGSPQVHRTDLNNFR